MLLFFCSTQNNLVLFEKKHFLIILKGYYFLRVLNLIFILHWGIVDFQRHL